VAGLFDAPVEKHQQTGHEQKHRQHGADNALGQDDTHVEADAELHQHQGHQAGDSGEGGGGDLHDGLAQGGNVRLSGVQTVVPLLHIAVAEDNGVIDGQGKLEHHGDGVGDEGNRVKEKVGAHVEDGGDHKHNEKDQDLQIALGGEQEYRYDDGGGNGQNDRHLLHKAV